MTIALSDSSLQRILELSDSFQVLREQPGVGVVDRRSSDDVSGSDFSHRRLLFSNFSQSGGAADFHAHRLPILDHYASDGGIDKRIAAVRANDRNEVRGQVLRRSDRVRSTFDVVLGSNTVGCKGGVTGLNSVIPYGVCQYRLETLQLFGIGCGVRGRCAHARRRRQKLLFVATQVEHSILDVFDR